MNELARRLERAIERRATLAPNKHLREAIGEFAGLPEERRAQSSP